MNNDLRFSKLRIKYKEYSNIYQNHSDFEKTMIEVIKLHERRETRMKILNFPRRVLSKIKRTLLRK